MNLTTIQLTDDEAKAFIKFQKHYVMVNLLESLNVFEMKNGSVQIHFDHEGKIRWVEINRKYKGETVEN